MLDAYVDAHLYDFDAGPELSLRAGFIKTKHIVNCQTVLMGMSMQARF
jgi:hypothetical protein